MSIRRGELLLSALALCAVAALAGGACAAAQSAAWNGLVITANEAGHSISLVDTATWKAQTVELSLAPHNVQTSADRRFLYATVYQEMNMSHMDMLHMSEMDIEMMEPGSLLGFDVRNMNAGPMLSVPLGMHPAHVVLDSQNRFAYVTVSGENAVKIIDLRAKAIAQSFRSEKCRTAFACRRTSAASTSPT
jgi:DNA-binding beta-propeller fold protein YncE